MVSHRNEDFHHFLYQRKHWDGFWAKRLRQHPYCGAKIPTEALHQPLHNKIHDIPCPPEHVCEYVWYELRTMTDEGVINSKRDNPVQKLSIIIELLREYNGNNDDDDLTVTIETLKWQKDVIYKFYTTPQ